MSELTPDGLRKVRNRKSKTLTFSLQNDVNLRHNFFLNLYFRLRKTIIKNLETKD